MARRTRLTDEDVAALARQAVDAVASSRDPAAAAARVLEGAREPRVQQAILDLSAVAPDRVTSAVLRAALDGGSAELAQGAAELLTSVSDAEMAAGILQRCFSSDDASVRRRATAALEGFAAPSVLPFLTEALQDDSNIVRRTATGTLGLVIGTPHHPLRPAILEQLSEPGTPLAKALLKNPDNQVRRQAVQSMPFAKSASVLPAIQAFCSDEDDEVRQEAVLALATTGGGQAVELMEAMLDDPSDRVASSALDMLAAALGAGSSEFLRCLTRAIEHPTADVRRHAVLMLNRFGPEDAGAVLEEATHDEDFEVARRAGEILRRLHGRGELDWLGAEMAGESQTDRALAVWEGGNIGLEGTVAPGGVRKVGKEAERLVPMLERVLREGSASDRLHAVSELAGLCDIADSAAMQAALADRDPSVQSRAADTFEFTRDAALLAGVAREHPEPTVRRRALEALAGNPGGPVRRGAVGPSVSFAETRTIGMELFGCFLAALGDPDEGVRQQACGAIRDAAQRAQLVPIRETVAALDELADDERVSFLLQEEALHSIETVAKSPVCESIIAAVDGVLEWRGEIAREAHSVLWSGAKGGAVLEAGVAAATAERWIEVCRLGGEHAASLRAAVGSGEAMTTEAGLDLIRGLTGELCAALSAVTYAAIALRLAGGKDWGKVVAGWASSVSSGPQLRWEGIQRASKRMQRLHRWRKRAWIEAVRAELSLNEEGSVDRLLEAAQDEDDWVKMVALAACCAMGRREHLDRTKALAREHRGDPLHHVPVGLIGVELLRAGDPDGADLVAVALEHARTDFRMELAQQLLIAAQDRAVAGLIEDHLVGRELSSLADLCLAVALCGAGAGLEGLREPLPPDAGASPELRAAWLAVGAVRNDAAAAGELEHMLRDGEPLERYYAAHYLALARARSTALIFASVRDQEEAPFQVRAICAASLVKCGHPGSVTGLEKTLSALTGRAKADLVAYVGRAVEDTIPLMLECTNVNAGRFV